VAEVKQSLTTQSIILAHFLACGAWAAAVKPADLPRMEICLNGAWETILNADGGKIPAAGWSLRRTPAMPIATNPPTTSVWYRLSIQIPREWSNPNRRFLLRLDKAGHYSAVYWNGRLAGEHYGQFTPFEADVTGAMRPGEANEIAIFVHNASGKYARLGVELTDPMEGNAYRGATDQDFQRNWVGIVGDIFLTWRPATHISAVFAVPSVRKHELEDRVDMVGAGPGLALRAAVLDDAKIVLRLPEKPAAVEGALSLKAAWSNPVLWGPEPYGKPKLYVLRTELRSHGKLVDRRFTRFGFREVWIEGRDVLLNGKKLWMAGTYFSKLAPIRYLNDRHPQSRMIEAMQAAGLNTSYGHWDDLGEPWLDRCDEMGMLALGAFYCDGRPKMQSKADSGWADWMTDTCRLWVRTTRNHPSIVMWRPTDVLPQNLVARRDAFNANLAAQVRREDGTRPLADDSDITAWSQSPLRDPRNQRNYDYDDGSRMAAQLAASSKPLLTKEIYAGFADVENLSRFFRNFYEKSYSGGSTGILVQHLPVIQGRPSHTEWLSDSGRGNRDSAAAGLPNWYDPAQPAWTATPYNDLFADLQKKFVKRGPSPYNGDTAPELLISGLAPDDLAILVPQDPDLDDPLGVRADTNGTAWIVAPWAGSYRLYYKDGSQPIRTRAQHLPSKPGYDSVERINVKSRR
jgi:hypothetical protein